MCTILGMTPETGNDVALIMGDAIGGGVEFATVQKLPVPYLVDHNARRVYLNGALAVPDYFAALAAGVVELEHKNVIIFPTADRRPATRRRSS